jgi:hypothetical protein
MSAVATAIAGSALVGGAISADAARKSANIQAGAAGEASAASLQAGREANQLQWQMYQQNLANQAPFLQGGQTAYAALLGGMGMGAPGQNRPGFQPMPGTTMPAQGGMFTDATGATVDSQGRAVAAPGQLANYGATPEQMAAAAGEFAGPGGGQFRETFTPSSLYEDPSYKWRLEQGLQALKSAGAATGTLQTGQGLKDITNYAQGAASQEYQSAYDRFMRNQETAYGRLAGLAGIGTNTAGNIGAAGQTAAGQIGSNIIGATGASSGFLTGGAAAQAAGAVGAANAFSGAANNAIGNWMGYQALQRPQLGYYNQGQFMGPPGP